MKEYRFREDGSMYAVPYEPQNNLTWYSHQYVVPEQTRYGRQETKNALGIQGYTAKHGDIFGRS